MKTDVKIYAALVVLLLAVGGLYLAKQNTKAEATSHSATSASADYPAIAVPKDDAEKITKIEITSPNKDDKTKRTTVVLEKKGDDWMVVKPVAAKGNTSNVRSLIDNLKELKVKELIDRGTTSYDNYEVSDAKAVHVMAWKGADKTTDLYFGKSGSRGQMARVGGKDGVYIAEKYSSYLYTREVKNWRELGILKFEDANAIGVEVTNKNGFFSFSKNGDKWASSYTKRDKDGSLNKKAEKEWKGFDEGKVKDLLRAYKGLSAEDFAEEKADTGLDKAEDNGGIVHIKLKDNAGEITVKVGKTAKGTSRYAIKDGGDGTVYTVSSWAADWATAAQSKFEKGADDKKAPPGGMPAGMQGMPPGMQGMPGMPGGDDEGPPGE
jgi:cytoskeletal protein RodZ